MAHPAYEEQAWELVTNQPHHDLTAYKTLPLNGFEKVAIISAVLIPRWTYMGLFLQGYIPGERAKRGPMGQHTHVVPP